MGLLDRVVAFYTVTDLAEYLGIDRKTVRKYLVEWSIPRVPRARHYTDERPTQSLVIPYEGAAEFIRRAREAGLGLRARRGTGPRKRGGGSSDSQEGE